MSEAKSPPPAPPPPPPGRGLGAFLSFLVPGLGQIYQGLLGKNRGRLIKGVFFLVVLYGMFFYGMWLGRWQNVYLPHVQEQLIEERRPVTLLGRDLPVFLGNVYTRLQYAGQFWIGVAAWPALWNYLVPDTPVISSFQASPGAVKGADRFDRQESLREAESRHNALITDPEMGKQFDLAWVYTVIAGVLNILVIYDAWAGPIYSRRAQMEPQKGTAA